jgi:multisubunit Na+/H+ antiporter MnhF subunit
VNVWLAGAAVLLVAVLPCIGVALRGTHLDALVALELATTLVTVALVLLAQGYERPAYFGVALTLAPLGVIGSLVFIRFIDRGL